MKIIIVADFVDKTLFAYSQASQATVIIDVLWANAQ